MIHATLQQIPRWIGPGIVNFCLIAGWVSATDAADDTKSGEAIYQARCQSCHGPAGEGSDEYGKPLIGEKSIGQLTRLIDLTMPEDDPESCAGAEARSVAAYIHESFYSRTAQERNRPARIELSRLTVRQFRNSLADLVGSFRSRVVWTEGSGLRGQYYKSRRIGQDKNLVITHVDPKVEFDFGVEAPRPEGFDRAQFSIVWKGSVLIPDTGDYDFVVHSDQAIRLFVNDPNHALIDASVASAEHTEQRASIFLLGGRAYPISLEFSKAKQGVDDSKDPKKKIPEKKASIRLAWQPPRQVEQVIPTRFLSPDEVAESFVPTTPFPPDDRSVGYERGSTISKAWDNAVTDAAIETCLYVTSHLRPLSHAKEDDPDRVTKLRQFCQTFTERAFRHPLASEQVERYVTHPFEGVDDPEVGVRRSILLTIKSPYFLYRGLADGDPFDVASRISYTLCDAPPDDQLLEAARRNQLANRVQIARQAERMLTDVRAKAKIRDFFLQWLKVDPIPDLTKDSAAYPGFDPLIVDDLRTSLELWLDDLIWGSAPDFRRLLASDEVYLNGRLAAFYGQDLPPDAPFQKVTWHATWADGDRAGILTHPYLLAHFAYTATSSPIHRGVFLMRSILGRTLRPPPEAIAPLAPDLHAGLSTRQRVELQTSPKACVNCHSQINPLGFGLENFDAVGRFRRSDRAQEVDAAGSYEGPDGSNQPFQGARELGMILASSPETHAAFATQLFHQLVKQPIRAFGPTARADLTASFQAHDFDLRKLVVEIVTVAAGRDLVDDRPSLTTQR